MTAHAPDRYTGVAIALHWLMAAALIGLFLFGKYMTDLPDSPWQLTLYNWHRWAGTSVLALAAVRLAWRLTHRPPAPASTAAWQGRLAAAGHAVMYLLFFVVPLAGWAYSSAAGFPLVWLGVLPLPDLVGPDKALAAVLKPLHGWSANLLMVLVALHVAAALEHHFVRQDGRLARIGLGRVRRSR